VPSCHPAEIRFFNYAPNEVVLLIFEPDADGWQQGRSMLTLAIARALRKQRRRSGASSDNWHLLV
jgi:hypothetical protein